MNKIKAIFYQEKFQMFFFCFLAVIVSTYYGFLVHNRTMPFAEGWYTFYAKCINSGMITYKDFEYLFSPFYINFIALFTKVVGYKIISLRLLGVVIFSVLSALFYFIFCNMTKPWIAFIASVVSVFYMQSEIVQVFYDYVRVMDLFCALSVLLLMLYLRKEILKQKNDIYLVLCGISTSLFILIKQNMGLIFFAYVLLALGIINVYFKNTTRKLLKKYIIYISGVILPIVTCLIFMEFNGSLDLFLTCTGGKAISAKGGMTSILFNWIINGKPLFLSQIRGKFIFVFIIIICSKILNRKMSINNYSKINVNENNVGYAFFVLAIFMLFSFTQSEYITSLFHYKNELSPYFIFDVVIIMMLYFGQVVFKDLRKRDIVHVDELMLLICCGAYFAISYGCGTSGGLAEGQATLGIGLIIIFIYNNLNFKNSYYAKFLITIGCLLLMMQFSGRKMLHTYSWWGMDESDYWNSTEVITNIPLLEGMLVSKETKGVYENINAVIQAETEEYDEIYCFPQIPLFYNILNRNDIGVYAKVQWFDVASDSALEGDIEIIKKNPPKAIIMYDTNEFAYAAHEKSFRNGKISGTRKMREFLYNYIYSNRYSIAHKFTANNNSITVWIKGKSDLQPISLFCGGNGMKGDPYLIGNIDQFLIFRKMLSDGRTFDGMYIDQINDLNAINLDSKLNLAINSSRGFYGTYDGNGYAIKNISTVNGRDLYLFPDLYGTVKNLEINLFKKDYVNKYLLSRNIFMGSTYNCYTSFENKQKVHGIFIKFQE